MSFELIQNAFATDDIVQPAAAWYQNLLPMILIVVVFYFLLLRPQQKKIKEQQNIINKLAKGDKIITNGGLIGTIVKVEEQTSILNVEIAQGVRVKIKRDAVAQVFTEPTTGKISENGENDKVA